MVEKHKRHDRMDGDYWEERCPNVGDRCLMRRRKTCGRGAGQHRRRAAYRQYAGRGRVDLPRHGLAWPAAPAPAVNIPLAAEPADEAEDNGRPRSGKRAASTQLAQGETGQAK